MSAPRSLVKVEPRAAGRGQLGRNRVHLLDPAARANERNGLARAICGAAPEARFVRLDYPRAASSACPRCYAKVRPGDTVTGPELTEGR